MFQVGSIFIPVTQLEISKQWYKKNFGLILVDEWTDGAGYVFSSGSTSINLIQVTNPQPSEFQINQEKKNVYFNLTVHDIEQAWQNFKNNGATPTDIHNTNTMKSFDIIDPDGNVLSIIQEKLHSPFHKNQIKERQEVKF
ncbi:VOC family protein [Halobacillus massiliensis]|uniref:VOC family protein n=1 Tax=Halobacillus massiliensis TaxID=1926286 RepID=UPI0009E25BD1|nr:VOC family protein [Halobacillus massiliensis]